MVNGSLIQVNNRQAFPPLVPISSEYTMGQTTDKSSLHGRPLRAPKTDCIQKADQPSPELLTKHQGTGL